MKKFLLPIVLILLFTACNIDIDEIKGFSAKKPCISKFEEREYPAEEQIITVSVKAIRGSITIEATPGENIKLEAEYFAENDTHMKKIELVEEIRSNRLYLTTNIKDKTDNAGINYRLSIPDNVRVSEVFSISGKIFIEGIKMVDSSETVSGDQYISDVKTPLEINSVSGNIYLNRHQADIKVKTVSGEQYVTNVKGDCNLRSVSGNIVPLLIEGTSKIRTVSGSIKVTDLLGTLEAVTVSGDITAQGNIALDEASTTSGNISMEVSDYGNRSMITTVSGSISLNLVALDDHFLTYRSGHGKVTVSGIPALAINPPGKEGDIVFGEGTKSLCVKSSSGHISIINESSDNEI